METQWAWANTPIGSKSLASPEADRRSWMQWHARFQALTPHSAAPTAKPCGTALTLLTMEWTPSTARFGWACSYSCDEGSKASFSTQPHWLFQQTIMNHTHTQEKTSKASFHLHLLLSQKTSILFSPSLQGKPPKEGRHSPVMMKLLVLWKCKHCFYSFNNSK